MKRTVVIFQNNLRFSASNSFHQVFKQRKQPDSTSLILNKKKSLCNSHGKDKNRYEQKQTIEKYIMQQSQKGYKTSINKRKH